MGHWPSVQCISSVFGGSSVLLDVASSISSDFGGHVLVVAWSISSVFGGSSFLLGVAWSISSDFGGPRVVLVFAWQFPASLEDLMLCWLLYGPFPVCLEDLMLCWLLLGPFPEFPLADGLRPVDTKDSSVAGESMDVMENRHGEQTRTRTM